MPRLFSGLEIPTHISERLSLLCSGLDGARWISPENHHVTLRFLGDVDGLTADRFHEQLSRIKADPFTLTLDGLGSFGRGKPRAVWAGFQPSDALMALNRSHERAAQDAGMDAEARNFHPHVTLARLRSVKAEAVARYLSEKGAFLSEPFEVTQFVLYSARESTGGGPYVIEEAYPLDA